MNNYTYSNYTLFAAGDSYGNYLVLEEDDSYNHLDFNWDLSDTEVSAIAHKFYTVGLTDDDFRSHDWEETDFRENSNGFQEVKQPVLKVYVNEASYITIVLHMGKDDNIWAYFDDEDAVQFLISYFDGNGKWDNMEDFEHLWGKKYFMDKEMEELVDGLTLVGENGIISDEVTEEWPVSKVLARAGFCWSTERVLSVNGMIPTQADLDVIATYMDDDLREALHEDIAPCTPEYFLREYIWRYKDEDPGFLTVMKEAFNTKWVRPFVEWEEEDGIPFDEYEGL